MLKKKKKIKINNNNYNVNNAPKSIKYKYIFFSAVQD